jgi:thiol-disulfide isomerase/thioredoxin
MRFALVFLAACAAETPPAARPLPVAPATALVQLEASADLDHHPIGHATTPTVVLSLASWCEHCRHELAEIDHLRAAHPHIRWLALDYKAHEEYDGRGSSAAIRALADSTPWLRIVPADDALFAAFGNPPKVPTLFVFDRAGTLVTTYDRRDRAPPEASELDALLRTLE